MKILIFSDTHGGLTLPSGSFDLVILLGDIDYYEVRRIDETYSCPKIGVLGNHDGPDQFFDTRITDIHEKVININGITFAGFGGCPRYNRRKFGQYEEWEAEKFTDNLEKVDVFIAHSNAQITTPDDIENPHRGFLAFTNYLKDKKPRYFLHGHLHKNEKIGFENTEIISVYPHAILSI